MPKFALLVTDEPMTAAVGGRRLRAAGYDAVVVPDAARALRHLSDVSVTLAVVDLDLSGGLTPEDASALRAAVSGAGTLLVAVATTPPADGTWPVCAQKPYTAEQVRAWRARTLPRLGMAESTPVSFTRLTDNLGGDPDNARAMLADYVELAMPQHDELRRALSEGDLPNIANLAHRVCGALGAIEAREASATCRQLMQAAGEGDSRRTEELATRVLRLISAVEGCIEGLCGSPPARLAGG